MFAQILFLNVFSQEPCVNVDVSMGCSIMYFVNSSTGETFTTDPSCLPPGNYDYATVCMLDCIPSTLYALYEVNQMTVYYKLGGPNCYINFDVQPVEAIACNTVHIEPSANPNSSFWVTIVENNSLVTWASLSYLGITPIDIILPEGDFTVYTQELSPVPTRLFSVYLNGGLVGQTVMGMSINFNADCGNIPGCIDPVACNFDPQANEPNGSCLYNCYGCMDPAALNYDATALFDDGSCIYELGGCTYPLASNFNPLATFDDMSCIFYGCTDPFANNYIQYANTDDGSCDYSYPCPTDFNHDGTTGIADLLQFAAGFGQPCP